jgi:hypothetical protein
MLPPSFHPRATFAQRKPIDGSGPISAVLDVVARQKQRNSSRVQSDRRGGRIDASAMECEAKASPRAGFGREFDEPIALPNGRYAPHDLGSAANAS